MKFDFGLLFASVSYTMAFSKFVCWRHLQSGQMIREVKTNQDVDCSKDNITDSPLFGKSLRMGAIRDSTNFFDGGLLQENDQVRTFSNVRKDF